MAAATGTKGIVAKIVRAETACLSSKTRTGGYRAQPAGVPGNEPQPDLKKPLLGWAAGQKLS